LDGAQKALDAYINFPTKYPEVADNEIVKNPEYPAAQFAFNIFFTAYNDKNVELMNKYYDLALQFDNKDSHNFVLRAKPQMLKDQGKTDEWIVAMKEMIALSPDSEVGEIGMQQLMSHYNSVGNDAVDAYTNELVEKYPNNKIANYCRGFAFYAKSDFDNAITYFQKSVEIDPNYADGLYNCGYCYYQNALEKARAISGKKMKSQAAIKAAEDEVKALFAKAAPYFEKYRDFETKDPARWAAPLKVIYNNTGEKEKAAEMDAYLN
jgi:tetratricopeptide (TPR) repeat protein